MDWRAWSITIALSIGFVLSKPLDDKQCLISDFKEQEGFDVSKFAGRWHHLAASRPVDVDGVNFKMTVSEGLSMVVHYSKSDGKCLTNSDYKILTDKPGRYNVSVNKNIKDDTRTYNFIDGILVVLETDYNNALLYICTKAENDGTCNHGNSELSLWSREKILNDDWRKLFSASVNKPCLGGQTYLTNQEGSCDSGLEDKMLGDTPLNPACAMPMCATRCDHGYLINEDGCQTCDCKPDPAVSIDAKNLVKKDVNLECAVPMCANRCEHGYKMDENNCETCQCKPPPDGTQVPGNLLANDVNPDCPVPMCADRCEHGYLVDENNCQTCQCKPPADGSEVPGNLKDFNPDCPVPMCAKRCEHGYRMDEKNCQTCECKPPPMDGNPVPENLLGNDFNPDCPVPMCAERCEHGYRMDENNCQTCECKSPTAGGPQDFRENVEDPDLLCATPMCTNWCPHGYAVDSKGCDTCDCVPAPQDKSEGTNLVKCPLIWCELSCPKGLATDEVGCPICACRISTPCPIPMCEVFCKDGYATDDKGCQTCVCLPSKKTCNRLDCNLICENGYKRDDNDCPFCECRTYSACPVLLCTSRCPFGNVVDQNGCATCDCLEESNQIPENIVGKPTCTNMVSDIPDFDPFQINGRWHILASRADLPHTDGATTRLLVDPHQTIRTFYTGHRNGTCLPTFLGSYTPVSGGKTFRVRYGSYKTGTVRFLYADENYEYILLHQCLQDIDNNVIPMEPVTETPTNPPKDYEEVDVEILVNDAVEGNEITPKDPTWCENPIIDIISKRLAIPEVVWDDIESTLAEFCLTRADMDLLDVSVYCQPELNCDLNGIPSVSSLNWKAFQGTWFAVAKTDRRNYDQSEQFKFVVHDGTVTLYHIDARGNECRGITKAKIVPDIYNPGELIIEFGRERRKGKIVYTDYEVAVYYECHSMGSILDEGACPPDETQITILHRNRVVPNDLLQRFMGLVEMMCVNPSHITPVDHTLYCPIKTGCYPDDFLGQPNLNTQKFLGRWNNLLMKHTSAWDFLDMEIISNQDNSFTMTYTGAVGYNCTESMHAMLYPVANDPGTFRIMYGVLSGYLRVIWTDYRYALLYECHKQLPSGGCYPDSEHVTFVGRPGLPLPATEDIDIDNLFAQICKERSEFTFRRVDCHLAKPEFVCKANGVSMEANFTLKQVEGEWFVLGHTRHRVQNLELVKLKVQKLSEEKVAFLTQQYMQKSGSCIPPTYIVGLRSREHPAEFYSHSGKRPGLIRFAYVTKSAAILYICPKDRPYDTCQPSGMTVVLLSRTPTLDQSSHWDLMQKVADMCVSPSAIIPTKYNYACVIIPPYTPKCKLNNMPVMKKFDMKQFIGTWYVTSSVGRRRYGSPMLIIQPGRDYFFLTFYGTERSGKCHIPRRAILQQRPDSVEAVFDIKFGEITGTLYVVYTDYENALIYECDHVDAEGRCLPTHAQAYFISRNISLDMRLRAQLAKRFPDLCLNPYDIKEVVHEVDCSRQPYQQCSAQMPGILEDVDVTQLTGIWYSLIRSSNAPSWPGGVANFTLREDGGVELTAAGKRYGECLLPVDSNLIAYAGASMWVRQDGGYVQLIGAGENYVVLLQCLTQTLDQCNPENAQIDVLGRTPRVNPAAWELLEYVTESMCFGKLGFAETSLHGSKQCPLEYELKQAKPVCTFSNLDQLPKPDIRMFLGEWHTFAHLKHYPIPEAVNYQITMEHEGLLKGYIMGFREGKCLPTYAVYIKDDDTGLSHFKTSVNEDFTNAFDSWLLFSSSKNLVLFECYNIQNNSCRYDDAFIQVLSRTHDLPDDQRGEVYDAMTGHCFEMSDYVAARQTDECQLRLEDRNCSFDAVEAVQTFDVRSVVGPWYKIQYSGSERSLATSVIFLYRNERQLDLLQFGKRSNGVCFEEMTGPNTVVNSSQPGVFRFYEGSTTGLSKIIYQTEKYLVFFQCLTEDPALTSVDECPLEKQRVHIYSKSKEVSVEDMNFLTDVVFRKTCSDTRLLVEVPPSDDCLLATQLKSCRVDDIGMALEDTDKILGAWYQLARSTSMPDLTWDSGMTIIEELESKNLKVRYRGRFRYNDKKCTPLYTYELKRNSEDASLFEYSAYPLSLGNGIMKIIYVDENFLFVYHCFPGGLTSDGLCLRNKENIGIFSRRRFINSEMMDFMFGVLRSRLCASLSEMVLTNQTRNCYIGEEYQQPFKVKSCEIENIPVQEEFDKSNFSGIWYEIEGTRNSDHNIWEAVISRFEVTDDFLTLQSSGKSDRKCRGPYEAIMRPRYGSKQSGDMLMWSGNVAGYGSPWTHPFFFKIVYTDYQAALLYACHDVKDDGTCRANGQQLYIISKSTSIDSSTQQIIYGIINAHNSSICVSISDMMHSVIDDSCIDMAKEEYKFKDQKVPGCKDFSCDLVCDMGYQINQLGCPMCACNDQETPEIDASGDGEIVDNSINQDADESKISEKTQDSELHQYAFGSGEMNVIVFDDIKCPPVVCSLDCPNGLEMAENGCILCQCAEIVEKTSSRK